MTDASTGGVDATGHLFDAMEAIVGIGIFQDYAVIC